MDRRTEMLLLSPRVFNTAPGLRFETKSASTPALRLPPRTCEMNTIRVLVVGGPPQLRLRLSHGQEDEREREPAFAWSIAFFQYPVVSRFCTLHMMICSDGVWYAAHSVARSLLTKAAFSWPSKPTVMCDLECSRKIDTSLRCPRGKWAGLLFAPSFNLL